MIIYVYQINGHRLISLRLSELAINDGMHRLFTDPEISLNGATYTAIRFVYEDHKRHCVLSCSNNNNNERVRDRENIGS